MFIQCLHQHTPLSEVLQHLKRDGQHDIDKYLRYKEHVCRQVYADAQRAEENLPEKESQWPEYSSSKVLAFRPSYQTRRCNQEDSVDQGIGEGRRWLQQHLGEHVQELQELKQHHVHVLNDKGERVPLTHCRRPDNPSKCKSDFPRTKWLIDKAVVLCQGLLQRMGMACSGRKSKLGGLHGPMNHESLSGTSPAMLAVHQFNSDVQIPYRLLLAVLSCVRARKVIALLKQPLAKLRTHYALRLGVPLGQVSIFSKGCL